MKVIVLGSTGFLGQNLLEKVKNTNHEVFGFSKSSGLDLFDYSAVLKIFAQHKPEAIINCAAHTGSLHYVTQNAAQVFNDNALMALNIYKAAAKACPNTRIINPLSNCSYPGSASVQKEEEWLLGDVHPSVFAYGHAKRYLYVLANSYKLQHNLKTVNFLVPNTFGPKDHSDPNKTHALNGMIIRMLKAKKNDEKEFEIWGTGKPVREWAYVDDVINFLILALTLEQDLTYPVNIAQNKGYSIKESAEFIAQAIGYKGKLVFNTKYQDGAPIKILDNTKFSELFSDYKFYDHQEGIKNTVEYYKKLI